MVPVVVGSPSMVTKNLAKHLGKIGIPTKIELLQKAALLGSARLLRNVLEAESCEIQPDLSVLNNGPITI